jgi:DNA-binding YbaB/EbfC family protein
MPDLNALMKQAQKLQGDVAKIQEEIAAMQCDGAAGGGLVTATVNGQFELVKLKIDKTVVDPNDIGMLEDLVTAAYNAAYDELHSAPTDLARAHELVRRYQRAVTGDPSEKGHR